jgi:hypothetical protein
LDIREALKNLPAKIKKIPGKIIHLPESIRDGIIGYRDSYRKGVEKFGIWWTVFQVSIWGFILIFILTAVIIFVFYLPKIEMINWKLRY